MNAPTGALASRQADAYWSAAGWTMAVATLALAGYQFFYTALTAASGSAEANAVRDYAPVFMVYLVGLGLALCSGPHAFIRAQTEGVANRPFSIGCVLAAVGGAGMSFAIGNDGVGGETMHFYWAGLGAIWIGSIAMVHLCARWPKPLAVRDWTVYAYAMALIPLSLVPSLAIWPLFFDLDAGQTIMTAATASFAAHFLAAHYVIFEILEKRRRTPQ